MTEAIHRFAESESELTIEEFAAELGIPKSALEKRLYRPKTGGPKHGRGNSCIRCNAYPTYKATVLCANCNSWANIFIRAGHPLDILAKRFGLTRDSINQRRRLIYDIDSRVERAWA